MNGHYLYWKAFFSSLWELFHITFNVCISLSLLLKGCRCFFISLSLVVASISTFSSRLLFFRLSRLLVLVFVSLVFSTFSYLILFPLFDFSLLECLFSYLLQ